MRLEVGGPRGRGSPYILHTMGVPFDRVSWRKNCLDSHSKILSHTTSTRAPIRWIEDMLRAYVKQFSNDANEASNCSLFSTIQVFTIYQKSQEVHIYKPSTTVLTPLGALREVARDNIQIKLFQVKDNQFETLLEIKKERAQIRRDAKYAKTLHVSVCIPRKSYPDRETADTSIASIKFWLLMYVLQVKEP